MTDINVKLLDISSASDGDVLKYVAANGTVEYGAAPGASAINTSIVTVTAGSFYIDSSLKPTLSLEPGSTYKFDQSDSSNSGHPLRFSTISDGTHSSGTEYTTGVTYVGTPGSSGSYTQIVVNYNTPTLYYYCSNHSGMGSSSVVGNPVVPAQSPDSNRVVYDLADPTNSIVLDAKDGLAPATFHGDIIDANGNVIVDVSSTTTTFTGGFAGNLYGGDIYDSSSSTKVLESGSNSNDSILDVYTANTHNLNTTGTTTFGGTVNFSSGLIDFIGSSPTGTWNGNVATNTGSTTILNVGTTGNGLDAVLYAAVQGDVTGDVTGDLTGNLISASNGAVVVDSGSYNQANFYGILNGDLNGTIRNSLGQLVLDNGSIGGTPNFGGNVAGDLTGNVIGEVIHKTTGAKVINMQYPTSVYTGNVVGDLEGTIRNSLGQLVLDNGSIGGTPSFGGVSDTVANLSNHSIQALGNINSNDTIASGDFMLYDNSSNHFGFVNFQSEVNSYITAATTNLQIQDLTDVDSVDSLATGDILLYDNSSSQFSFTNFEAEVLAYVNASTAHNANDYATYTTVTGLINTVQANLTSVIGAAPTTLDTLAEIAAALENDANIAVTLTNAIGTVSANAATNATNIDTVQANLSVLPDSAANDYSTYTTVTGLINTVQANVTALPDSAANDYSTYTTLSGLIDTVQDNVVATGNTTNTWVNSNDHTTYTTVTANLYNTYASLHSEIDLIQDNVNSLTSIVDSADANLYNTYNTVTGLIDTVQDNVGLSYSVYGSSDQFTVGSSNTFSLSSAVSNVNNIIVSLNGIVQYPTLGYEVSGSTLTLANTSPIKQGLILEVRHLESGITAASWSEVNSNIAIASEEKVIVDTSTTSIVITLPSNPTLGNEVRIIDGAGNASNNSITLFGNGSNIEAETSNVVVDVDRSAFTLVYYNTYQGWLFGEK